MEKIQLLKISDNKRFMIKADGSPFFWLGDTAWELFSALNREEAELYLKNRAERGFTVIQAVAFAELDGLRAGNAYKRKPLLKNSKGEYDPTIPDLENDENGSYSYWAHMDYVIDIASELGLYIGLLPTWGDKFNMGQWGKGPEIFDGVNARLYGRWIGERYRDKTNIIWIMGGDRLLQTEKHYEVINAMAEGIKEGDNGIHLMTFHPAGNFSSSYSNHSAKWLDFNMMQSGHDSTNRDNHTMVTGDYLRIPTKPTLDGEPRYEDHPIGFNPNNGYFDDFDVRQAAYWAVFAGAFGHTYGHHSIWCMCKEPKDYFVMDWKEAILRPGGSQMQHLKNLMLSRPFLVRIPDQELVANNFEGANYISGTRGEDYAFIYTPNGLKITVRMGRISGEKVKAYWFNPRSGDISYIGIYENVGDADFIPPSRGRGNDWVLILDDASKSV